MRRVQTGVRHFAVWYWTASPISGSCHQPALPVPVLPSVEHAGSSGISLDAQRRASHCDVG